ncbi:unnamed protein product [Prorocentrum cordatum]|uniref:Uncharacterized protein n=1 Tax=Prorocentrum cordatum TaxID=2364126 RepID=A0ABN9X8G1_9DINO|nr:unnamed protein product [Polarella glacialis]
MATSTSRRRTRRTRRGMATRTRKTREARGPESTQTERGVLALSGSEGGPRGSPEPVHVQPVEALVGHVAPRQGHLVGVRPDELVVAVRHVQRRPHRRAQLRGQQRHWTGR